MNIFSDKTSPLHSIVNVAKIREIAQLPDATSGETWFGQLMKRPQLYAYLIQMDAWLRDYKVKIVD